MMIKRSDDRAAIQVDSLPAVRWPTAQIQLSLDFSI